MSKLLALCPSSLRPGSALNIQIVNTCLGTALMLMLNCKTFSLVVQEDIVARFGKKTGPGEEGPPAIAVT